MQKLLAKVLSLMRLNFFLRHMDNLICFTQKFMWRNQTLTKLILPIIAHGGPTHSSNINKQPIYLFMKERSLLFLFCLSSWNLPNHSASCHTHILIGKPLMIRDAHQVGFIMFWPMVETLLNIEYFSLKIT